MISDFKTFLENLLPFEIFGQAAWRWAAFGLTLIAATLFSLAAEWLVGQRLRAITRKSGNQLAVRITDVITPVIRWAVLLFVARHGIHYLQVEPWIESIIVDIFKGAYALLIAFMIARLIDRLLHYWGETVNDESATQLRTSLIPSIAKLSKFFIFMIAILLILQNAGYNIASLLTGLGIGGLAVALAAQETLANFFGSITVFCDKPFKVGDRVQVEGFDGTIEKVGLRSTAIRLLDGTSATIPNSTIAKANITNITRRPSIRHTYTLNLTYDTSCDKMEKALEIIRTLYREHPLTEDMIVNWRDYGAHSLDILVVYWCRTTDYKEFLNVNEKLNLAIKRRLEDEGIEFAFPTQTLHLKK